MRAPEQFMCTEVGDCPCHTEAHDAVLRTQDDRCLSCGCWHEEPLRVFTGLFVGLLIMGALITLLVLLV